MRKSVLDEHGIEHPDPTPVEIPTRLKLPQRQVDRMREMIRQEMSQAAQAAGVETFDEADDFFLDDVEFTSPYEEVFEPADPSPPVPPASSPPPVPEPAPPAAAPPAAAPPAVDPRQQPLPGV